MLATHQFRKSQSKLSSSRLARRLNRVSRNWVGTKPRRYANQIRLAIRPVRFSRR
jgi:hypothetical protein